MRPANPFDYWENHSSAIKGLGGHQRSPDPAYCFHTSYHEVRPGHASFVLRLTGLNATVGELSVRVHAWKPGTDANIGLVSGSRLLLDGQKDGELSVAVPFAAVKGVLYAFYGYLSEDADVTADHLQIGIDEPESEAEFIPDAPRSVLGLDGGTAEARPANALLHHGRPTIDLPVSQDCTQDQITALASQEISGNGAIARWSEALCLNALGAYGAIHPGLEVLVAGAASDEMITELARRGLLVRQSDEAPPSRLSSEFADILLMPFAFGAYSDAAGRWDAAERWLGRLKIGGLAVLGLRYQPDGDPVDIEAEVPSRNEIGRWALRLIGAGYSLAPLSFAPVSSLALDSRGLAGFVMILQRS